MRARGRAGPGILLAASVAASAALAQQDSFPLPPRQWPSPVMDTEAFTLLLLDRLEYRSQAGPNVLAWDVQGWAGGDRDKFWLKTSGEKEAGRRTEQAEVQLLYARRVAPFWFVQAGARRDWLAGRGRNSAVVGVQGMAPYWFGVEAMLFGDRRGVAGRVELENDLRLAQRLILQPRLETAFASYADRERGTGSGIQDVELGLRLRYEVRREFAPYVGVDVRWSVGATARSARSRGADTRTTSVVVGARIWY